MAAAALRRQRFLALARRRAQPGRGSTHTFLRERTWRPLTVNLPQLRTPFVIVGDIATALYMPQRLTLDLDLLVHADDAARLYQELPEAGYSRHGDSTIGGTSWRAPDRSLLDVLESREPWVRRAIALPNRSPLGDPVIGLPYLVLMKLAASRSQDLADLSRMLGAAHEETLAQVRETIRVYRPDDSADLESLISLGQLEFVTPEQAQRDNRPASWRDGAER